MSTNVVLLKHHVFRVNILEYTELQDRVQWPKNPCITLYVLYVTWAQDEAGEVG